MHTVHKKRKKKNKEKEILCVKAPTEITMIKKGI